MSMYRKEWDCCGSVTETESWEPEECPFCSTPHLTAQSNAPALSDEQIINLAGMSNFGWKDEEGFWRGEGGEGTSELLEFARHLLAAQGRKP